MIIDICIVNATRSQKPAPNHCAVSSTELPASEARDEDDRDGRERQRERVGEPALEPVGKRNPMRASIDVPAEERGAVIGRRI